MEAAKQDIESEPTSKPKKPFQTKPKPTPKPQRQLISTPSLGMSWNRDLQFWFAFKSVSFISGPSTSTAQSVDKRDIVDVTDLVCSIAAQALADLGYQPQPQ